MFKLLLTILSANALNICPRSHPYPYHHGTHCCKNKVVTPSSCPGATQHVECPLRSCSFGGCPHDYMYHYNNGKQCCKIQSVNSICPLDTTQYTLCAEQVCEQYCTRKHEKLHENVCQCAQNYAYDEYDTCKLKDCKGTPGGNATVDKCNVCGGNNNCHQKLKTTHNTLKIIKTTTSQLNQAELNNLENDVLLHRNWIYAVTIVVFILMIIMCCKSTKKVIIMSKKAKRSSIQKVENKLTF